MYLNRIQEAKQLSITDICETGLLFNYALALGNESDEPNRNVGLNVG